MTLAIHTAFSLARRGEYQETIRTKSQSEAEVYRRSSTASMQGEESKAEACRRFIRHHRGYESNITKIDVASGMCSVGGCCGLRYVERGSAMHLEWTGAVLCWTCTVDERHEAHLCDDGLCILLPVLLSRLCFSIHGVLEGEKEKTGTENKPKGGGVGKIKYSLHILREVKKGDMTAVVVLEKSKNETWQPLLFWRSERQPLLL